MWIDDGFNRFLTNCMVMMVFGLLAFIMMIVTGVVGRVIVIVVTTEGFTPSNRVQKKGMTGQSPGLNSGQHKEMAVTKHGIRSSRCF